jgi:hypothetical protein
MKNNRRFRRPFRLLRLVPDRSGHSQRSTTLEVRETQEAEAGERQMWHRERGSKR